MLIKRLINCKAADADEVADEVADEWAILISLDTSLGAHKNGAVNTPISVLEECKCCDSRPLLLATNHW